MMNKFILTNYLSFIYKYKSFMDTVCPEIVNRLNEIIGEKYFYLKPFYLTGKKAYYSFCGYEIYNEMDKISTYIGLNYNFIEEYISNEHYDKDYIKEIKEKKNDLKEYFFSIDILKSHCKEFEHKNTFLLNYENRKPDQWVYFHIPKSKKTQDFIDCVVDIIKINHKVFDY